MLHYCIAFCCTLLLQKTTRAVVTKNIPPYAIVGGIPAKKIRSRFDEKTIDLLQQLQWWDWDTTKIRENLDSIIKADVEALRKLL